MAELTPDLVVRAYCAGAFPMAEHRGGSVAWYRPDPRTVMPLDPQRAPGDGGFHVPRSLGKFLRRHPPTITRDRAFDRVIAGCAAPRPYAEDTWINDDIIRVFTELHHLGIAHSVEAWDGDDLIGGIYGLALNAAFFGESMFSRRTNASKACLVHLVEHLRTRGFTLFDVQLTNPHLQQFGVIELPHRVYMQRLHAALGRVDVSWG